MLKLLFFRLISSIWVLHILISRKKDSLENTSTAKRFIKFNNKFTLKRLSKKNIRGEQIAILLPHCIQEDKCPFKITSELSNCKECGKCDIAGLIDLERKYSVKVKVATGGTLARKFVKESGSKLIIAVACERDLVSGIYDSYPMPVYGVFNERINGPCYNTKIDLNEVERAILEILKGEGNEKKN